MFEGATCAPSHGSLHLSSGSTAVVTAPIPSAAPGVLGKGFTRWFISEALPLNEGVGTEPDEEGLQGALEEGMGEIRRNTAAISGEDLVIEAWSVVRDAFLDARGAGWSEGSWEAVKTAALRREIKSVREAHAIISSMVASLRDPYSRFITPAQFARLAKYDITGVGLNIGELPGGPGGGGGRHPVVVGIVLGSPAYRAGIRQGDELVEVDGREVGSMSSFDVASLIQGEKGTPVEIAVRRPRASTEPCRAGNENGLCPFKVLRAADAPDSPVVYRLERRHPPPLFFGGAEGEKETFLSGYIRVKEFNAVAKRDLVRAIEKLQAAGAQSLVLDLQDNPGGLVQAGVEVAKLFLHPGSTVVYTQARGGAASERGVVSSVPPLTGAPLTVLVNGRTASASEIVAAALHDNCRAVLAGSTTYGKGLIQSVYELQDGSGLILTVGKYVTPAHKDIDRDGIVPDFRRPPELDVAKHRLASCQQP